MALETLLLALGASDAGRLDELATTAADLVDDDGTVVLLHVFDRDDYEDLKEKLDVDPDSEVTPDDIAGRSELIRDVRERLDGRGVASTVRGALGEEGESIVRVATSVDADHVVVGGRHRSPTGKAVFGSTAQHVLLNAPAPVTFVRVDEDDD